MQEPLPPSVSVGPTQVGVSIVTDDGVVVQVSLPRPRGLRNLPAEEVAVRAKRLAKAALLSAFSSLDGSKD
jgi:hypothetical protein